MLGKLLKYEFKSTSRVLWFLYAGLIIVSLLFGIVMRFQLDFDAKPAGSLDFELLPSGSGIIMTILITALTLIWFLLVYAIFITTTVVIVMRFYKNMLGGEGYLMHTLPVKTSSLIMSKLITSFCWMVIAGAVVVISTLILGLSSGIIGQIQKTVGWSAVVEGLKYGFGMIGVNGWSLLLLIIISTISTIIMYYACMAIGNLANNHKFLFSVLAYVGIQIVLSIIVTVSSIVGSSSISDASEVGILMTYNTWSLLLIQLVMGVGGFFLTNYLLSKKLNLA